jgi:AcrR family transcriptional regulator
LDIKDKILKESQVLFWKYGVKSVTMDDISKHLGISKKTIYQYFQEKDEIVCLVTETFIKE